MVSLYPNAKAVAIEAFLYVFLFAIMFLMAVCAQRILLSGSFYTFRLRKLGISHLVCHNCGFGILVVAVYFHIVILTALRTHGPSLLLLLARRTSSVLQQGEMAIGGIQANSIFPFLFSLAYWSAVSSSTACLCVCPFSSCCTLSSQSQGALQSFEHGIIDLAMFMTWLLFAGDIQ